MIMGYEWDHPDMTCAMTNFLPTSEKITPIGWITHVHEYDGIYSSWLGVTSTMKFPGRFPNLPRRWGLPPTELRERLAAPRIPLQLDGPLEPPVGNWGSPWTSKSIRILWLGKICDIGSQSKSQFWDSGVLRFWGAFDKCVDHFLVLHQLQGMFVSQGFAVETWGNNEQTCGFLKWHMDAIWLQSLKIWIWCGQFKSLMGCSIF